MASRQLPDSNRSGEYLASLLEQASLCFTPCDHGQLVWQQWSDAGTPLVLIHGGFGSWNHWVSNIPFLRERFALYTLDLPGLGDSADMPEPHTPEHFARIVSTGINQLLGGTPHFQLAGFSFGAMIGVHVAALAGSRCERFTAIGAAGCGDLHVQVHLQRPPSQDTPEQEAHSIHHANLRALMFSCDEVIDDLAVHVHAVNLARHRFNRRRLSLTSDFVDNLPRVQGQLVGVWGGSDATAGGLASIEKRQRIFLDAKPNSEFHILHGVGHWAMYEATDSVDAILCGAP